MRPIYSFPTITGLIAALMFAQLIPVNAQEKPQQNSESSSQQAISTEQLYQNLLPSTMTLLVETKDGKQINGSAFMGVKDNLAVTAWHVVSDARRVTAKFSNGEEFEVSGLVDKDERRDVALIRVKVYGRSPIPMAPADPAVGAKAFVIGAPKGLEFSLSDGIISGIRTIEGFKNVQFTCAASQGNSGGPLVNAKGEAIGVVSWQRRDAQNLNFAIPVSYVLALDATLPTIPWESVKSSPVLTANSGTAATEGVTATNDEFDKTLAEAIIQECDLMVVSEYVRAKVVSKRFGYENGLPITYHAITKNSKNKLDELTKMIATDPTRERQKQFFIAHLHRQLVSAALLGEAVQAAQRNNGYPPEVREMLRKSIAEAGTEIKSLPKEDWEELKKSKSFMETLPNDLRLALPLGIPRTKFSIGALVYIRNPLALLLFEDDCLAKKIGLKENDVLIGTSTQKFNDMEEFRLFLLNNAGKKIKIRAVRDGKEQDVEIKIPSDLPR